jgi:hypothetical protein
MDRRSVASKARRKKQDSSSELRAHEPTKTSGERSRTIVAPSESAARDKPRGSSLADSSLTPHTSPVSPAAPRQITRHTMQSKFEANSLKTNDGHPHKVTHFSRGKIRENESQCYPERSRRVTNSRPAPRSTSLTPNPSPLIPAILIDTPAIRNALNSNQSNAAIISNRHRSRVPLTVEFAPFAPSRSRGFPGSSLTNHGSRITIHAPEALPNLLSSAEPLRIVFRCMIVVPYKRNFFEPGERRWALLFSGPKVGHPSKPYRAIRREND